MRQHRRHIQRPERSTRGVADADKVMFAREQRAQATRGEEALWEALRGRKLGVKFRRQHAIGDFVLDFYCAEARLAVEIDGPVHQKQAGYDAWRDGQLAEHGVRTLRFSDSEVCDSLEQVLARIREALG